MTDPPPATIDDVLGSLAGRRIPGGCDDCDAYQTTSRAHGIWTVNVNHDDWCPWLAARRARAGRTA